MIPRPSDPPWERWRAIATGVEDRELLRRKFDDFADTLSSELPAKRSYRLENEWRSFRLDVRKVPLGASGGGVMRKAYATVYVNQDEPLERRRYTVAHELGHLVLNFAAPHTGYNLSKVEEEAWCEAFASRIVISRKRLRDYLQDVAEFSPDDMIQLCRTFRVSLTAMGNALTSMWSSKWGILLICREREYPEDSGERAYRVETSVNVRPWYFPKNMKLEKLGMQEVILWLRANKVHYRACGTVDRMTAVLWDPRSEVHRSGRATARASWSAAALRNGIVLLSVVPVDVEETWFRREGAGKGG